MPSFSWGLHQVTKVFGGCPPGMAGPMAFQLTSTSTRSPSREMHKTISATRQILEAAGGWTNPWKAYGKKNHMPFTHLSRQALPELGNSLTGMGHLLHAISIHFYPLPDGFITSAQIARSPWWSQHWLLGDQRSLNRNSDWGWKKHLRLWWWSVWSKE